MRFNQNDLILHNDKELKILRWIEHFDRLSEGEKVMEFRTWIKAANIILEIK